MFTNERELFNKAVVELGSSQAEIATLAGLNKGRTSELLNGKLVSNGTTTRKRRELCRRGLLVQALLLGLPEETAWAKYGEHVIFGLDEPDPAVVMVEVRERVLAIREQGQGSRVKGQGEEAKAVPA